MGQLSLCATTTEPVCPGAHAWQQDEPHSETRALQLEKARVQQQRPAQPNKQTENIVWKRVTWAKSWGIGSPDTGQLRDPRWGTLSSVLGKSVGVRIDCVGEMRGLGEGWQDTDMLCVRLLATPWTTYSPWNSPGQNTGVGNCSLLQLILDHLSHQGSPRIVG